MTSSETVQVRQKLLSRKRVKELLIDFGVEPGASWQMEFMLAGGLPGQGWEWLPGSAVESGTGLALFTATVPPAPPLPRVAVAPPFPLAESGVWAEFSPLVDLLEHRWTVAIILIRLGHYAFGIAEDERLVISKTGGRYVKNRQRQGGQSANRFVRNREKWMQQLFDEAAQLSRSRTETYGKRVDWLVFGGDRTVLSQFSKRLTLPDGLTDRVAPWRAPVDRPGLEELKKAVTAAWSCRVWEAPAA